MPFYHADEASARQETCKQDAKAMLSGCEMRHIGAQNIAFCMTKTVVLSVKAMIYGLSEVFTGYRKRTFKSQSDINP